MLFLDIYAFFSPQWRATCARGRQHKDPRSFFPRRQDKDQQRWVGTARHPTPGLTWMRLQHPSAGYHWKCSKYRLSSSGMEASGPAAGACGCPRRATRRLTPNSRTEVQEWFTTAAASQPDTPAEPRARHAASALASVLARSVSVSVSVGPGNAAAEALKALSRYPA